MALIEVSTANLISLVPEVADARYDFATGTFRTGEGQPVTNGVLDGWSLASERNRAPSVGRTTLKRGILLNSLARAELERRPGLLERALRQQRDLVERRGLSGILYQRQPLFIDRAIVAHELATATRHPDYAAAKAGDVPAAVRLAQDLITEDLVRKVRAQIGDSDALIVPVVSVEASGRNKIPPVSAVVLADRLGLEATSDITQVNTPKRTALSGLDRIFATPEFDGPVEAGRDYLLLDDTLTQGGTFAALAGHIESQGGRVVGAVALTGKQYSATLRPDPETLAALREKHGDIESDFRAVTGYGFEALTQSEARYLANFKPADAIRDRILAERDRSGNGTGAKTDRPDVDESRNETSDPL